MRRIVALLCSSALSAASTGCWSAHERSAPIVPVPGGCESGSQPICTQRAAPCDALALVAARCTDGEWSCPLGASVYVRPWADDTCLPLEGRTMGTLFSDGVHEAPVPVALGDRCAWVFPEERDGTIELVAIDTAPSCAALHEPATFEPIADLEGDVDFVALEASFEDAEGTTRVLARGWRFDPLAPFGVRSLGVGLGRVRAERIAVNDAWLFGDDVDLGDAAIVVDDFLYAYGCPGEPDFLEESCIVGRAPLAAIDDVSAWAILGDAGWGAGTPQRVFGSGPHRSSVIEDPRGSGFLHVYAIGFGSELLVSTASAPEGPWSAPHRLAACDLPSEDPGAYCAGPIVHRELLDPLDPGTLVVSYAVGTTAPDGAERRARDRAAYWPRVVRVAL